MGSAEMQGALWGAAAEDWAELQEPTGGGAARANGPPAPGALEALVESAGLTAHRAFEVYAPFVYADAATAQRANLSAGPSRAALTHAGVDAVGDTFTTALAQSVQPDGTIRLDNVFRVVLAHA